MKGMKAVGRYGSIGFELLASIAVGYYFGSWLDRKLGTHWIAFVGFLVGCYAGFRALFRTAKTMQRDIERDEALERGEDPWAPPSRDDDDDDDAWKADAPLDTPEDAGTNDPKNKGGRDEDAHS